MNDIDVIGESVDNMIVLLTKVALFAKLLLSIENC